MYDFCEAHAEDGGGIEAYLDQETAIVEMVRKALEQDDSSIAYLVREETGQIVATGVFRDDRALQVIRSDGTVSTHRPGVED